MNMCRRNAGNADRPPSARLSARHPGRSFSKLQTAFRCLRRQQRAVRGGRRRRQLQSGLCGVLQPSIRQVDAAADLHEHRTQLRRSVQFGFFILTSMIDRDSFLTVVPTWPSPDDV